MEVGLEVDEVVAVSLAVAGIDGGGQGMVSGGVRIPFQGTGVRHEDQDPGLGKWKSGGGSGLRELVFARSLTGGAHHHPVVAIHDPCPDMGRYVDKMDEEGSLSLRFVSRKEIDSPIAHSEELREVDLGLADELPLVALIDVSRGSVLEGLAAGTDSLQISECPGAVPEDHEAGVESPVPDILVGRELPACVEVAVGGDQHVTVEPRDVPVTPDMAEDQFRLQPRGGDLFRRPRIPPVDVEGESPCPAVALQTPFADRSLKRDLRCMKGQQGVVLTGIDDRKLFGGDRGKIHFPPTQEVCVGDVIGGVLQSKMCRKNVSELKAISMCWHVHIKVCIA